MSEIAANVAGVRSATETARHVELRIGSGSYSFSLTRSWDLRDSRMVGTTHAASAGARSHNLELKVQVVGATQILIAASYPGWSGNDSAGVIL